MTPKPLNNILAAAAVLLLAACAGGFEGPGGGNGLPSDVNRFLKDRAACGSYSADAMFDDGSGFAAEQGRAFCSGSDGELARLRQKYAGRADVLGALNRLENRIEQDTR